MGAWRGAQTYGGVLKVPTWGVATLSIHEDSAGVGPWGSCLAVFTSRESLISVIEDSADGHMLLDLAARPQALSPVARAGLLN